MRVGKLFYEDEEGERHLLGSMEFDLKVGRGDIMETLLNEYWEPRLNAASCRPVVQIDSFDEAT